MTERAMTGDARSRYRRAQAIAKELGIPDSDMEALAEGVREFDAQRSTGSRTAAALERIARNTVPESGEEANVRWLYEERRLRRREVYAQELIALAYVADDGANLEAVRDSAPFKAMVGRLAGASTANDDAAT